MKRTVLIISADQKVHSSLKSLRRPGLNVREAPTGLGALFVCAAQPVAALVIDLATPGMDWPRFMEKLSQAFPGMPVVTFEAGQDENGLLERLRGVLDSATARKQPASAHAALPMARVLRA